MKKLLIFLLIPSLVPAQEITRREIYTSTWQTNSATGALTQNSTYGGNIVLNRSKYGVLYSGAGTTPLIGTSNRETVAAAGSTQSNATALANVLYHRVSSADGIKGVKLVAIADSSGPGSVQYVFNQSSDILKLYPNTNEYINGTINAAVFVAAWSHVACFVWDSTNWYCG